MPPSAGCSPSGWTIPVYHGSSMGRPPGPHHLGVLQRLHLLWHGPLHGLQDNTCSTVVCSMGCQKIPAVPFLSVMYLDWSSLWLNGPTIAVLTGGKIRVLNASDQPLDSWCLIPLDFPSGEERFRGWELVCTRFDLQQKARTKTFWFTVYYFSMVLKRFLANGTGFELCRNGEFPFCFWEACQVVKIESNLWKKLRI